MLTLLQVVVEGFARLSLLDEDFERMLTARP